MRAVRSFWNRLRLCRLQSRGGGLGQRIPGALLLRHTSSRWKMYARIYAVRGSNDAARASRWEDMDKSLIEMCRGSKYQQGKSQSTGAAKDLKQ